MITKPIILDETGQGIKTVIAEVKTAIDNQSTKMETALSEVKTAIENHSGGGSTGEITLTDRTTGTKYVLYVDNGKLTMEEE